jgi:hypothetical protein
LVVTTNPTTATATRGGSLDIQVTASAEIATVYVYVEGSDGYWEAAVPPGMMVADIVLKLAKKLPAQIVIVFVVVDTAGNVSPPVKVPTTITGGGGGNTAITVPSLGSGFDYYQGSYNLGWSFIPNAPIQITALGFYDDQKNGLMQSHPVAIYDKATKALLTSVMVSPSDPIDGFFHYAPLEVPLTLSPGTTYVVVALVLTEKYVAFFAVDPLWTVDPAISYGEGAVNYANSSATTLLFPDTFAGASGDFGPNFPFTAE